MKKRFKNKNKKKNMTILIIAILTVIAIVFFFNSNLFSASSGSFAKCLTEKGAKMYGTSWCGYCNMQKEMFGNDFKDVDFTDCDEKEDTCDAEGISGYPTWKINNQAYTGVQSFEELSTATGCEI